MKNLYIRSLLIIFIIISGYYNLRLTYHQRWNTSSTWAWDDYFIYLNSAGICYYSPDSYTYKQDFENFAVMDQLSPQRECVHSPGIAGYINEDIHTNGKFLYRLDGMLNAPVKRIKASLWVNPGKKIRTKALFVCKIQDWRLNCFYYREVKLDDFIKSPNNWYRVTATYDIPEWVDQSNNICFVVWNKFGTSVTYFDDIKIRFEKK
jgi:hypothetical protein